jgi:uncharacterized protein YcbK (DUF882 family)
MLLRAKIASIAIASLSAMLVTSAGTRESAPRRSDGLAQKKGDAIASTEKPPLLATLVQTHSDERVPLDSSSPTDARFDALLADRATASTCHFDPRLLGLLRTLAARHIKNGEAPRIELVSGYRSAKLNEMMRKKGHHVASHSQHSLGHAVDFRIIEAGADRAIDPRDLEQEIRALGWTGGVGTYLTSDDWFVHADVGPNRHWRG